MCPPVFPAFLHQLLFAFPNTNTNFETPIFWTARIPQPNTGYQWEQTLKCFLVLRKASLGSYCVVVWVLFLLFFLCFTLLGDLNTKKLPNFPANSTFQCRKIQFFALICIAYVVVQKFFLFWTFPNHHHILRQWKTKIKLVLKILNCRRLWTTIHILT